MIGSGSASKPVGKLVPEHPCQRAKPRARALSRGAGTPSEGSLRRVANTCSMSLFAASINTMIARSAFSGCDRNQSRRVIDKMGGDIDEQDHPGRKTQITAAGMKLHHVHRRRELVLGNREENSADGFKQTSTTVCQSPSGSTLRGSFTRPVGHGSAMGCFVAIYVSFARSTLDSAIPPSIAKISAATSSASAKTRCNGHAG